MNVLSFESVHKSYGDVVALRDVSLDVRGGEVFGLLGPNGAGKTTLIRILMDIIRPDSGRIVLFGRTERGEALDRVGYLPEERGLYLKHRVVDVMAYFGKLKGLPAAEARERARVWLERIGLPEVAAWPVQRLSKGMSQKVQIAATLLPDPQLAVLDEPFSGLDPVNVRLVRELIRERSARGRTTILSTHQMNMVETLCDRVALISRGQVMVYGAVDEVRRQYSRREVRLTLDGPLPELAGVDETVTEAERTWRLQLRDGVRARDLLDALLRQDTNVLHFEHVLAPMEDVFIRVVQQEQRP